MVTTITALFDHAHYEKTTYPVPLFKTFLCSTRLLMK